MEPLGFGYFGERLLPLRRGAYGLDRFSHTAFRRGARVHQRAGRLESDGEHGYWIWDIDEPVPGNAYYLRVGPMRVNHRIVHAGVTYSLSDLAANERVRLEVIP